MPNYLITIHLKIGKPKQGIRWHPSYDPAHVRNIVQKKVHEAIGRANIDYIDVVPTARTNGDGMETKRLLL